MRAQIALFLWTGSVCSGLATGQIIDGGSNATHAAITRAVAVLPRRPAKIVVMDQAKAQALRPTLSKGAEAFVPDFSTTIHLVEQGDTLRHAAAQGGIFDYGLAVVIWHEMAHVDGASEREAQLREEALWQRFIIEGRVDRSRGLAYLALLTHRRQ